MNKQEKIKRQQKAKEITKLKGFRITLIILFIILISLVSFMGIYVKDKNNMANIVPEFNLGSDIKGSRVVELNVVTEDTITLKDSDGNEIASGTREELENQGYTEELIKENSYEETSEKTNKDEVLNQDNYEKAKKIVSDRLKNANVTDYKVRQNKENGNMIVELKEDKNTDNIISTLAELGKFEMKDSETEEVLIDNNDVKDAKVLYTNTQSGVSVYLEIQFNREGKEKLKELSKTYTSNVTTEETANNTVTNEITEADLDVNNISNETTGETTENSNKKIDMIIDGTTIAEGQQFEEENGTGKLDLFIGSGSAISGDDQNNQLETYINQAQTIATLISNGEMPIKYSIESNKYIEAPVTAETIKYVVIGLVAVVAVMFIVLIVKFKSKGLLATISNVGFLAVILVILRLTNVEIGIGGIIGLALIQLFNYILMYMMLNAIKNKKENDKPMKDAIVKFCMIAIPAYIVSIVFAFSSYIPIYSFGMVVFWGITMIVIYNLIITRNLFIKAEEK